MKKTSLSVIVPVYNEKQNIEPSVKGIIGAFKDYSDCIEVLFVDDNSPDGTAEEVNRVSASIKQVKLIQHGKKEGLGAAHKAGYESALGEYILCIDADLSQSPDDLLKIKNKLDEGYDLVIGSRYMDKGQQIEKTFLKDFGSRGMNVMCRLLLGIGLKDCTHTFKGFRKNLFEELSTKLDQKGHPTFPVQFAFWVVHSGKRVVEIPIIFTERAEGRGSSKISIKEETIPFLRLVLRLFFTRIFLKLNKYSL